jgi:hypothetical protein
MPLIAVNADAAGVAGLSSLRGALAALPQTAPVVVMLHGYRYTPRVDWRSPHRHILSLAPVSRAARVVSWPDRLGLGAGAEGLAVAFGWDAAGSLWRAWAEARRAGAALARVLDEAAQRTGRPAHVIAHSLGARVTLAALAPLGDTPALGRAILIAAAEFRDAAARALATPAGRAAEVLNVTSGENDPFDAALEWLVAPHRPGARSLGAGLGRSAANWTDLPLDDEATLAALAGLGFRIAPPARRVCHWSGYLRPGVFPLYRAVIDGRLPLAVLRAALPGTAPPRWSRLFAPPALPGLASSARTAAP